MAELPDDQQLLRTTSRELTRWGGDLLDALKIGGEEGNEIIETTIKSLRECADDLEQMMENGDRHAAPGGLRWSDQQDQT